MAELSSRQKEAIVGMLARFRTPAEVSACLATEHDLQVSIQQVVKYDPTRGAYEAGDQWRELFESIRAQYLIDVAKVPIAHQAYRLNLLQEGVFAARQSRNWKLVAQLLEQAAKEVGGSLTNESKWEMSGEISPRQMSSADRTALLGKIISEALQRRADSIASLDHAPLKSVA